MLLWTLVDTCLSSCFLIFKSEIARSYGNSFLTFWRTTEQFFTAAAPFCIPNRKAQGFKFLTNTCYFFVFLFILYSHSSNRNGSSLVFACCWWCWASFHARVQHLCHARILEWVAICSSRRSSRPRDQTCISCVSCIAGRFFTCWAKTCG